MSRRGPTPSQWARSMPSRDLRLYRLSGGIVREVPWDPLGAVLEEPRDRRSYRKGTLSVKVLDVLQTPYYMCFTMTKRKKDLGRVVSVRMYDKELNLIAELSEKLGVSHSDIIRLSVRQNAKKLRAQGEAA